MEIIIKHKVNIDKCIAKEIKELNNIHNILTIYSCCGHEKGECEGYIAVHPHQSSQMKKLGYEMNGQQTSLIPISDFIDTDKKKDIEYKYITFRAKSVCKGRC